MLRFFTRLAVILVGSALLAGPCLAHATLVESDPAEGSIVAVAPEKLRLTFNEPVTLLSIKLFAPGGQSGDATAVAQDNDLIIQLPADAGEGTYALSWRVASDDGHPVGGTSTFSIGHASQRATKATGPDATALLIWLARVGVYVGWIGGVGGAFFLVVIAAGQRPTTADRTVGALLVVGFVATALSFGLQGLDELDRGVAGLRDAVPWIAGLKSRYGGTLSLGSMALILGAIALIFSGRRIAAGLATTALLTVAFALTLSGHASTASPAVAARAALALHGAAAILWGGSLLPMLILVATRHGNAGRTAVRLSNILLPTVAVLALSGLLLAFLQGVPLSNPLGTDYGRLLAAKLALVLAMLALGALNRRILVPRVATDAETHGGHFRRVLLVDVCLLMLVLGVVAGWRFTPPPRSVAAAEAALRHRQMLHIHTDRGMAMVQIGARGSLDIRLSDANSRPLIAQEVRVSLANPKAGIEPLQRQATRLADGHWRADGLSLPVGGAWDLKLSILISDFETLSLEGTLAVP